MAEAIKARSERLTERKEQLDREAASVSETCQKKTRTVEEYNLAVTQCKQTAAVYRDKVTEWKHDYEELTQASAQLNGERVELVGQEDELQQTRRLLSETQQELQAERERVALRFNE